MPRKPSTGDRRCPRCGRYLLTRDRGREVCDSCVRTYGSWLDLPRKKCRLCGYIKLLTCFGPHRPSADGLESRCRECRNQDTAQWHAAHPGAKLHYDRRRRAREGRVYVRA